MIASDEGTASPSASSDALIQALAQLARSAMDEFEPESMLRRLCEHAAAVMDVDGAGVMVATATGMRCIYAVGEAFDRLEQLQAAVEDGPGRTAADEQRSVVITDLRVDAGDWPEFATAAAQTGVRGLVAVPLLARRRAWGVLDLYRCRSRPWTEQDLASAQVLAAVAVAFLVIAADKDEARRANEELERRHLHDDLTGLPNRALIFDRLAHAMAMAERRNRTAAVLFIDLDRFKQINDSLGHAAGDTVLREVAHRMAATLRESDTLGRLSGDEFVLVCEGLPLPDDPALGEALDTVIERLEAALADPVDVGGMTLKVRASIGVALSTEHDDADGLLGAADAAMYYVKQHRYLAGDADQGLDHRTAMLGRQLEVDLTRALERGELVVHYQPMVSVGSQDVVAVEALLRWDHPSHGLLPAGSFVGIAEAVGLMEAIGRWTIEQVCEQLATWERELGRARPATCYVNVFPRELAVAGLADAMAGALARRGLEPRDLGLEILEVTFMDPVAASALHDIHARGHPLSIDDFGTGYSSLSRLVELPAHLAKIDRSLTSGLPADDRQRALVEAIVVVARNLGILVVGEGVETEEQASYLARAGCDLLQGFHVGLPMPPDELTALLSATARSPGRA